MTRVEPGDLVFSFCDARVKALGTVQGRAASASKPEFGRVGDQWANEGWLVPVEFDIADRPIRPKDYIDELIPHLTTKYAPLQPNGNGNQGVYLTEVSEGFAKVILSKMELPVPQTFAAELVNELEEVTEEEAQKALQGRTDIGETQKQQLVLARRGQGVFKANVRLNETYCRLTGITDPQFLIASHIKPWRDSNDQEKLDGCNGLLLSPHVDRLFDRGLISFTDEGTVLKSPRLPADIWSAWGLDGVNSVGAFNAAQASFLAFHRNSIFKK
jgi:putative restriction endonuclease